MRALGLVLLAIGCLVLVTGCGGSSEDEKPAEQPAGDTPIPKVVKPALKPQVKPVAPPPEPAPEISPQPTAEADTASAAPEPGEVELVETEGMGLAELQVARGVEKRKPVDAGTSFSLTDGSKLYAFMIVNNPDKVESEVSVSWQREGGKETGPVTVKVGAQPRWRTWAFHSYFKKPGLYYAIVRDAEGELLGKAPFTLTD